jgi:DNA-binding transcriptional MerR regulator
MPAALTIGDFSRATHLSVKTLRHYHRVGLLTPADVDAGTGYRRYTTDQIPTAQVIRRFRDLDMPLDQIHAVLGRDMPKVTTGQDSVPTQQRAEVDWNAGAGGSRGLMRAAASLDVLSYEGERRLGRASSTTSRGRRTPGRQRFSPGRWSTCPT